jgi:RNA polymerase sigma-70 factor (ECF subfamily)
MNERIDKAEKPGNEDVLLVRAFQAGDKSAFDELALRHKDRVFNLCFRLLGDEQEANDSAQDVFVKIYRSLKKFRLEASFSTWLYRIGVNTCKNRLKSREYRYRKKMVRIHNPEEAEKGGAYEDLMDEAQSPVMEIEKKERTMMIHRAIQSLPNDYKAVVVLRDVEGLSYEEIAGVTGLKLGTVKSKLARARMDLREKLKGVI